MELQSVVKNKIKQTSRQTNVVSQDTFSITQSVSGDQARPQMSVLNDGSFFVAWLDNFNTAESKIMGRYFNEQRQPLTDEFQITQSTNTQGFFLLNKLSNGNILIAWQEQGSRVLYRVFDSTTRQPINNDVLLIDQTDDLQLCQNLANGNALIAWRSVLNLRALQYQIINPNGTLNGTQPLIDEDIANQSLQLIDLNRTDDFNLFFCWRLFQNAFIQCFVSDYTGQIKVPTYQANSSTSVSPSGNTRFSIVKTNSGFMVVFFGGVDTIDKNLISASTLNDKAQVVIRDRIIVNNQALGDANTDTQLIDAVALTNNSHVLISWFVENSNFPAIEGIFSKIVDTSFNEVKSTFRSATQSEGATADINFAATNFPFIPTKNDYLFFYFPQNVLPVFGQFIDGLGNLVGKDFLCASSDINAAAELNNHDWIAITGIFNNNTKLDLQGVYFNFLKSFNVSDIACLPGKSCQIKNILLEQNVSDSLKISFKTSLPNVLQVGFPAISNSNVTTSFNQTNQIYEAVGPKADIQNFFTAGIDLLLTKSFIGNVTVEMSASDEVKAPVSTSFTVVQTNQPPQVNQTLSEQKLVVNQPFEIEIPKDTFFDADQQELIITTTKSLPQGFTFNSQQLMFSGIPKVPGKFEIELQAEDPGGLTTKTNLPVLVAAGGAVGTAAESLSLGIWIGAAAGLLGLIGGIILLIAFRERIKRCTQSKETELPEIPMNDMPGPQ